MNMHFATIDRRTAERFLSHEGYNYLSDEAKEFILDNLSKSADNMLRVQDPAFYESPSLIMTNHETAAKIKALCNIKLSKQDGPKNESHTFIG